MLEVSKASGGYGDLKVLWDIDLAVPLGEITVVLGRNGAGKTTLVSGICGLLPDVGFARLTFDGKDIRKIGASDRVRAGIGYVQENKRIFRLRSVEENLLLGGVPLGGITLHGRGRREALAAAYDRFPMLADKRHECAGGLSGGQQQMLAIGQALMSGPRLLMLDEPSAGLAPSIVREVFAMVVALKQEGLTVLLIEQTIEQALEIADQVAVLESGRVVASGPVDRFSDSAIIREVYLGSDMGSGNTAPPATGVA